MKERLNHIRRISLLAENTLDSGINVAPGIFGKNNKHSPLNKRSPSKIADSLTLLHIAKGKES